MLCGVGGPPEVDKKPQQTKLFGVPARDVCYLLAALLLLYLGVSLFYTGLLNIAVEVRQTEWLKLPKRYFGNFDQQSYPYSSFVQFWTRDIREKLFRNNQVPFFNRPQDCDSNDDSYIGTFAQDGLRFEADPVTLCDADANDIWTLYPWIKSKGDALNGNQCANAFPDGGTVSQTTLAALQQGCASGRQIWNNDGIIATSVLVDVTENQNNGHLPTGVDNCLCLNFVKAPTA